jgi:hypothetical protein
MVKGPLLSVLLLNQDMVQPTQPGPQDLPVCDRCMTCIVAGMLSCQLRVVSMGQALSAEQSRPMKLGTFCHPLNSRAILVTKVLLHWLLLTCSYVHQYKV